MGTALCLIGWVLAAGAAACLWRLTSRIGRDWEAQERAFLYEILDHRDVAESEAGRLMDEIERGRHDGVVCGQACWEVLDVDPRGRRALVRACGERRLVALIGRDLRNGRPFFTPVPPEIDKVSRALEWTWDLPEGAWKNADEY